MAALKSNLVSSALFRGLVDHSVVGMLAMEESDSNLNLIYANASALETLELKDVHTCAVDELYPAADRIGNFTPLHRGLFSRDGMTSEVMMRKANQHHFLASLGVKRIELDGHLVILLSFRDITIEKKLSRDLQAKQDELERALGELLEQNAQLKVLDQAKDKFIALTTHELRTPLSAILATADVLELKLYESEEQKEEFIRTINEQGKHLLELVNDVLDFAKIRAGKMDFFVEHLKLKTVVHKIAGDFSHMAISENIRITVDTDGGPEHAWADLLRLKEVLNNVMSNAIKYNRTNGAVAISLTSYVNPEGQTFARVSIRDSGFGIPEDKQAGVFNEFETVGHVSRHHKGTGLGMPISRRLIESMGGALTLKSEVGVGSEFYIDIPVDKVLADDFYRSRPDHDTDFAA